MNATKKYQVGEIRPSQLLINYGIGSIIDLPHISAIVMGLDDWDTFNSQEIQEERLLQAIQSVLGGQVRRLLSPPIAASIATSAFDPNARIGVPVGTFPRWMVCSGCHLLASVDDGFFELKVHPQSDKIRYVHKNCTNQPVVLPSRFMIACKAGHLDDFPWYHFVHGERHCKALLRLFEPGVSGEPSDIFVKCETCGERKAMSLAFSSEEEKAYRPSCTGRRPHLRDFEKACPQEARPILLAASNTWFPLVFSTLSLPANLAELDQLVEAYWSKLQEVEQKDELRILRRTVLPPEQFDPYSNDEIWSKIEQKKRPPAPATSAKLADLRIPEWSVLSHPQNAPANRDFEARCASTPEEYAHLIEQVVLVERLREVRALTGFTRIESLNDYAEEEELPSGHIMPLARRALRWVPAAEVRGEGIFIQFRESAIQDWTQRVTTQRRNDHFRESHMRWRSARHIPGPEANYPGIRYILLHTFAHALMRQLTLECGYAAASIRERIYAREAGSEGETMAGVLLYTAASDSEGTLGGLVSQGYPDALGWHIAGAIEEMQYCASDPLCAEHNSREDRTLHEAACHACMFVPETSCERGNNYLDRSLLVATVKRSDLAFFSDVNDL
jgi:hypothetical protein